MSKVKHTEAPAPARAPGAAAIAFLFGLLTLVSGASVLFGPESVSRMAGEVVDFVLWFNFLSGPFYLLTGFGLWMGRPWAVKLCAVMALMCALVLVALLIYIAIGQAYEMRTLAAMSLRFIFWALLYLYAFRRTVK